MSSMNMKTAIDVSIRMPKHPIPVANLVLSYTLIFSLLAPEKQITTLIYTI